MHQGRQNPYLNDYHLRHYRIKVGKLLDLSDSNELC